MYQQNKHVLAIAASSALASRGAALCTRIASRWRACHQAWRIST